MQAGRDDPRAGILAPRLLGPDGSVQHSLHHFPTVGFALLFNLGVARVIPGLGDHLVLEGQWDSSRGRHVDWAIGAFLLVRREAWDAAGGFDAAQWMYAEDLDLGWRIRRCGWATRYVPEAVVHHRGSASVRQVWGDDLEFRWQRSTYAWMLRRRGLVRTRLVAVVNIAGALARFALLTPAAWVSPARWAWHRQRMRRWVGIHRSGLASRSQLLAHR